MKKLAKSYGASYVFELTDNGAIFDQTKKTEVKEVFDSSYRFDVVYIGQHSPRNPLARAYIDAAL